jgi:hypothetical protein
MGKDEMLPETRKDPLARENRGYASLLSCHLIIPKKK